MRLNLLKRFALAAALTAGAIVAPGIPATATTISVTDLAGRTVDVERNPSRVVIGEGRMIYTLALLDRAPFDNDKKAFLRRFMTLKHGLLSPPPPEAFPIASLASHL